MEPLPKISTEPQLAHLIYRCMFSGGDHPWSKPAKCNWQYLKCSIRRKKETINDLNVYNQLNGDCNNK